MTSDPCRTVRDEEIYRRLAEMAERCEAGVLATVIDAALSTPRGAGAKMIVHADGRLTGTVGGGAAEARVVAAAHEVLADGRCRRLALDLDGPVGVCGGRMEVFLEPVLTTRPFVVVGAGHVGRALLEVGGALPFRFLLVDDRPELLQAAAGRPGVTTLLAVPDALAAAVDVAADGAVLIASRSHALDAAYAGAILDAERAAGREFGFCGIVGSGAKAARIRDALTDAGHDAGRVSRLQMPVGVEVGGVAPAEIAVSVLAEVLAVLRGVTFLDDAAGRPVGLPLRRRRP